MQGPSITLLGDKDDKKVRRLHHELSQIYGNVTLKHDPSQKHPKATIHETPDVLTGAQAIRGALLGG